MVAIELRHPATGAHDAEAVKRVQAKALAQGLLLLNCGMYGNVIRFLYPLTIPDAQFDRALDIIDEALKA
jgi:4-aminobutyrate aminotransferase